MNEKHCVSLELSKRLKEVGYKQEGEFWWMFRECSKEYELHYYGKENEFQVKGGRSIIAPLASEIMERLPFIVGIYLLDNRVSVDIGMLTYIITGKSGNPYNPIGFEDDTVCNNLAKMYIYLAEHNLL